MQRNFMDKPSNQERTHSACSPSSLKARSICAGYEGEEDAVIHPVTAAGIRCHDAVEEYFTKGSFELEDEQETENTWAAINYANNILKNRKGTLLLEEHLHTHDKDVSGYVDWIAVFDDNTIAMRDWKFGYGRVPEPKDNPQTWSYVLGFFLRHEHIEIIDFNFFAPNQAKFYNNEIFTREDIPNLKEKISLIANRYRLYLQTEDPNLTNYDAENCQYCARKATCRTFLDVTLPLVKVCNPTYFESLPDDLSQVDDPEIIAAMLSIPWDRMKMAVSKAAKKMRFDQGIEIPGYKVVTRKSATKVRNTEKFVEALLNVPGLYIENTKEHLKITLTDALHCVKCVTPEGVTKKAYTEEFKKFCYEQGILSEPKEYEAIVKEK